MQNKIKIEDSFYESSEAIIRSQGDRTFVAWDGSNSVKSDYTRDDYNYFRGIGKSKSRRTILKSCQEAYEKVGIIQNVINLMSDFGSKGIRIRHSDKNIDKFCQKWSKKIQIAERSERFLNQLYRLGSVVIYEKYGRASNDITSKYIPIKYIFLNPMTVKVKDEDKGVIPSDFEYQIEYSDDYTRRFTSEEVVSVIPEELAKYKFKTLPKERISVYNYRKDDWAFWGMPITYPILDDLRLLEKLKLADISALDGASSVRLWTVGKITDNPNTTIIPTPALLKSIRNIVAQGVNAGAMDLVFGPEVSFTESSTSVHQFLGESKYKPTLDSIYDSLGIPSPLRSSNKDNNTGNAISLKTLIERLNYGRMYLIDFWTTQIKKIFQILGFKTEEDPIVEFDYMVLTDEAAEKKLLLDMIDRDIIDIQTVQDKMNLSPDIIKRNLKEEVKQRGNAAPVKAGPFHNAHIEDDMKKQLLSANLVLPSEIDLDVNVSDEEFKKRIKDNQKAVQKAKTLGNSTYSNVPGRPPNLTETKKREPKPKKAAAELLIWASNAQKQISDIFTPIALSVYEKKNVRSLTVKETDSLELAKAKILLSIKPFSEINESTILESIDKNIDTKQLEEYWDSIENITIDQKRQLTSLFYSNMEF